MKNVITSREELRNAMIKTDMMFDQISTCWEVCIARDNDVGLDNEVEPFLSYEQKECVRNCSGNIDEAIDIALRNIINK